MIKSSILGVNTRRILEVNQELSSWDLRETLFEQKFSHIQLQIIMKIFGFMFLSSQSNYDLFLLKPFKRDNNILHVLLNECLHKLWINTHEQKHIYCFIYSTLNANYGNTFPLARTSTHSFLVKQTFTTKRLK